MDKKYGILVAALVVFAMAITASALTSKTIERRDGYMADANLQVLTPDGFVAEYYSVAAIETQQGTDVSLQICGSDYVCRYGYLFTTEDVLSVDKNLDTATLVIKEITLYDYWGGGAPEVVSNIKITVTGDGKVVREKNRDTVKSDVFKVTFSGTTLSTRAKSATFSIGGNDVGAGATLGDIIKFGTATMIMEK